MTYKATEILVIFLIHLIWSEILGYYEPMPFRLFLTWDISVVVTVGRCWYLIPKETRKDKIFRKRCKGIAFSGLWIIFFSVQLIFISIAFRKIPLDFQWTIAFMAPFIKEINDRYELINCIFMTMSASPENLVQVQFIGQIIINIIYSFWLAMILVGTITKKAEFLLLGINFCINMSLCSKVIRLDKKSYDRNVETINCLKQKTFTALLLNELVEILLPLVFIGTFSLAYHGPNKDILWNIRNIDNLNAFLTPVMEMALIDSGSLILSGVAFLWFSRINIFQEYCKTIKKYWIYLAFFGGTYITSVSIKNI